MWRAIGRSQRKKNSPPASSSRRIAARHVADRPLVGIARGSLAHQVEPYATAVRDGLDFPSEIDSARQDIRPPPAAA